MKLYNYYRSTSSYRVRIALNIKRVQYEKIPVDLIKNNGEQHHDAYKKLNPQQLVPCLEDGKFILSQSLAIIEYLEERYPEPSLFPKDVKLKAQVRSLAYVIACEMHPLNNLRVLQYLINELDAGEKKKLKWYHHWLQLGFDAIEKQLEALQSHSGFCVGDQPSMADVCLIPQVFNAHRFELDMNDYPRITAINNHCLTLDEFSQAQPNS